MDPDGETTDLDADPDVDVDPDADDHGSEATVSVDQTDEDDNPSYRNVRCALCVLVKVAAGGAHPSLPLLFLDTLTCTSNHWLVTQRGQIVRSVMLLRHVTLCCAGSTCHKSLSRHKPAPADAEQRPAAQSALDPRCDCQGLTLNPALTLTLPTPALRCPRRTRTITPQSPQTIRCGRRSRCRRRLSIKPCSRWCRARL